MQVRLTLNQGALGFATAELSIDDIQTLALLCKDYVEMEEREDRAVAINAKAETVMAEGPS